MRHFQCPTRAIAWSFETEKIYDGRARDEKARETHNLLVKRFCSCRFGRGIYLKETRVRLGVFGARRDKQECESMHAHHQNLQNCKQYSDKQKTKLRGMGWPWETKHTHNQHSTGQKQSNEQRNDG